MTATPTAPASPNNSPEEQYRKAIDDMRAQAKWLLSIFAAIAGVLLAGISLSSIGKLDAASTRFWVAILAGAFALLMVGVILRMVTRVITADYEALAILATLPDTDPAVIFARTTGLLVNQETPATVEQTYYASTTQQAADEYLARKVKPLLGGIYFFRLREKFIQATWAMLILGTLTAMGIGFFAWAANPPPPKPTLFRVPAEATLTLSDDGKKMLSDRLGAQCVAAPVHVFIVSSTDTSADAVGIPTEDGRCKAAVFTIGRDILGANGSLTPLTPVTLPTALISTPSPVPSVFPGRPTPTH